MIIEGMSIGSSSKAKKNYLQIVQKIQLSGRPLKMIREDELDIVFMDEDAKWLRHPHDDATVITLTIANYTTRRVLVDNGSSIDIFYYLAFQQMRINKELLRPVNVPLIGFGGMKVLPLGTISLPIVVGSYLWQIIKEVNFLVVDCSSSYNAIIGRLTLNSWRVATSTYHLSVKFPTNYGIEEVQRDQLAVRECYLAMLTMDEHVQTMNIKEIKVVVEPTEVLKDIPLDENNPERFTRIQAWKIRQSQISFNF